MLREIAFYIADDNRDAAFSMLDRFTERFEMLASKPQSGRRRDELEPNLRSFPENSDMRENSDNCPKRERYSFTAPLPRPFSSTPRAHTLQPYFKDDHILRLFPSPL